MYSKAKIMKNGLGNPDNSKASPSGHEPSKPGICHNFFAGNGLGDPDTSRTSLSGHGSGKPETSRNFLAGNGLGNPDVSRKSSSPGVMAGRASQGNSSSPGLLWIRSMASRKAEANNVYHERAYRRITEAPLLL